MTKDNTTMGDTYTVKMRRAVKISVNCVENDREDIRCGGSTLVRLRLLREP